MAVTNLVLAYPNLAFNSAVTLSGGSWQPTLPVANLATRDLDEMARSMDLQPANTKVLLTLDRIRPVRVLVLAGHNLSIFARYRWIGRYSPGGTVVYDSGWTDVWPTMFDNSTVPWETLNWWNGKISPEDIDNYPRNLICVLPNLVGCAEWELQIDDQTNVAGYVEAAVLFVAGGWQPKVNRSWSYHTGYKPLSIVTRTPVGRPFYESNTPQRIATFSLDWLDSADAAMLYDIRRRADITDWFMFIPDASDTLNLYRYSFICNFDALADNDRAAFAFTKTTVSLIEVM